MKMRPMWRDGTNISGCNMVFKHIVMYWSCMKQTIETRKRASETLEKESGTTPKKVRRTRTSFLTLQSIQILFLWVIFSKTSLHFEGGNPAFGAKSLWLQIDFVKFGVFSLRRRRNSKFYLEQITPFWPSLQFLSPLELPLKGNANKSVNNHWEKSWPIITTF